MIRVLGMMSGTSMDGVDAAMIETDGVRIGGFGRSGFRAYSDNESAVLHGALGRWPGEAGVADAAAGGRIRRATARCWRGRRIARSSGIFGPKMCARVAKAPL